MKIWKTLVKEFIFQNRKNLLHWVFDKKFTLCPQHLFHYLKHPYDRFIIPAISLKSSKLQNHIYIFTLHHHPLTISIFLIKCAHHSHIISITLDHHFLLTSMGAPPPPPPIARTLMTFVWQPLTSTIRELVITIGKQVMLSSSSPSQSLPLFTGAGLSHDLDLVFLQLFPQADQRLQSPQLLSILQLLTPPSEARGGY